MLEGTELALLIQHRLARISPVPCGRAAHGLADVFFHGYGGCIRHLHRPLSGTNAVWHMRADLGRREVLEEPRVAHDVASRYNRQWTLAMVAGANTVEETACAI
jgi:hypothetical protein